MLVRAWPYALVTLLLLLLLVPSSTAAVASKISDDKHFIYFMVGPALYSAFGRDLVSGIDFYCQYGVGYGYLFSYLIAPTAPQTVVNYVGVVVSAMVLFYVGLFAFLRWFYESWRWALAVTLTVLFLQFHMDATFVDPSSYPLRYPLLALVCALAARWTSRGLSGLTGAALALGLGASLFLSTETGIYLAGAVTVTALLTRQDRLRTLWRLTGVGVMSAAVFMGVSVAAFGARTLDLRYPLLLMEPLLLYGGGYGALPIEWLGGWHYLYNFIAPGTALATVAWIAGAVRHDGPPQARARVSALSMLSLLALFMAVKYVNRSYVALWHVDALCPIAVMAWWVRAWVKVYGGRVLLASPIRVVARVPVLVGLAVLVVALLLTASDARNPNIYAFRAYLRYPSLLNSMFGVRGSACRQVDCVGPPVAQADVDLIRTRTQPHERVAIYSYLDWAFLIEARRPPKFAQVPSPYTHTRRQLVDSLAGVDLIFLRREGDATTTYGIDHPDLAAALVPDLTANFVREAEGEALVAWRRKKVD